MLGWFVAKVVFQWFVDTSGQFKLSFGGVRVSGCLLIESGYQAVFWWSQDVRLSSGGVRMSGCLLIESGSRLERPTGSVVQCS